MSVTLAELLRPRTEAEWLAFMTAALAREGFPLTDAHAGAVGRTLAQIDARALADLGLRIPQIAASGFIDLAAGPWLDLIARSQYGLERAAAVSLEGEVRFVTAPGFGPYQLSAPTWVATANRLLYATTDVVNVPQGGSVEARVRAEQPGSRYNVGPDTLTQMLTPLPGLAATNDADWVLAAGADPESDERLRERCRTAWPALGSGATRDAYVSWALNAHASVAKVQVLDMNLPRGPGSVDVLLASEGGGVGVEVWQAVNADIQRRRPLTSDVVVSSATPRAVTVAGTVTVQAGFRAQAEAQAAANLQAYQRALGIGDVVYRAALIEIWMTAIPQTPARGVLNIELAAPGVDIPLADDEVAVFNAGAVTWTSV